eukprot:scaffold31845_cov71-Phaeocystis_antarctica.AAC.1
MPSAAFGHPRRGSRRSSGASSRWRVRQVEQATVDRVLREQPPRLFGEAAGHRGARQQVLLGGLPLELQAQQQLRGAVEPVGQQDLEHSDGAHVFLRQPDEDEALLHALLRRLHVIRTLLLPVLVIHPAASLVWPAGEASQVLGASAQWAAVLVLRAHALVVLELIAAALRVLEALLQRHLRVVPAGLVHLVIEARVQPVQRLAHHIDPAHVGRCVRPEAGVVDVEGATRQGADCVLEPLGRRPEVRVVHEREVVAHRQQLHQRNERRRAALRHSIVN